MDIIYIFGSVGIVIENITLKNFILYKSIKKDSCNDLIALISKEYINIFEELVIKLKEAKVRIKNLGNIEEKIKMNIHIFNLQIKKNYIKKKINEKIKN